ncbi:SRPBCC domain-containing protein [Acidianus manzaensis]|uniref:Carbon monoxide dehydrogenase n=1 Tax=Acidianus manzaensis TaxID=282676 RepID=A0A1W6JXX4_9CREN|nr:SRPBCC domain-containing protein [Acidianus manzaensis]ARM75097.1 carbon monoxide dehydrogenase [Acidianus manzaensis]
MQYQGTVEVSAKKEEILNILNNLEDVAKCFPGIKSVSKDGDEYKVTGSTGIGFIKGDYKATIKFANVTSDGFELIAKGNGMNSNVDISAKVNVSDNKIEYSADVKVSGVLASVGARLMDPAINKMIAQLFECLKAKVESK